MRISLIATVKNEADNANNFLSSLASQSLQPFEVIITDANSSDGTLSILEGWQNKIPNLKVISIMDCSRSAGRNIAIQNSSGEIIAAADFGCSLNTDWLREISEPIVSGKADVTAGYYINTKPGVMAAVNSFFTHPALFEIDDKTFIPSTRSISFKKECWEKAGGFNEKFILGEDTYFGVVLRKLGFKIYFNKNAVVNWDAESSFFSMVKKLFNYSLWDSIGGFSERFYYKKMVIVSGAVSLVLFSFLNFTFFYLLLLFTGYFTAKTFIRAKKKSISLLPSLIVVLLKPVYDAVQSIGFLSGKIRRCSL